MCVPWELNPQPFAFQMECFTTEPQEHTIQEGGGAEAMQGEGQKARSTWKWRGRGPS